MQIAKMFASLGFKVDVSGLNTFKKEFDSAKPSVTKFSFSIRNLNNQLNTLGDKLIRVNQNLKFGTGKGKKADDGYRDMTVATDKLVRALDGIINKQPSTTKAFGKIHSSLIHGTPLWSKYADQVARVRRGLLDSNQQLRNLRNGANQRINLGGGGFGGGNRGGGGGGYGGGSAGGRPSGGVGSNRTSWLGDSGYQFFRSMAPSALISTGLAGAGYGLKEIVQRGREQIKLETTLQMNSANDAEYEESLKYIHSESDRLGMNNQEFGRAYSRLRGDAGDAMSVEQLKETMTGFSEFMLVLGNGADAQKGVFRALGQMMTNVTVQGDELNQLAEHGISKGMFQREAMKFYGLKDMAEYQKFQKDRKVVSAEVLPFIAAALSRKANQGGALGKAQGTSLAQQNRATNEFNALSKTIMDAGLDKALASLFIGVRKFVGFIKDTMIPTIQELLKPVEEILSFFNKIKIGMDELLGSGWTMTTMLGTLGVVIASKIGLFAKLSTAIFGASASTMVWWTRMLALFQFLGKFIFRLGAIGLAFWVLYKVAQAVNARMNNELSWADVWSLKLQILLAEFDSFFLEMKLKYMNYRLWVRSFNPSADHASIEEIRARIGVETGASNSTLNTLGAIYKATKQLLTPDWLKGNREPPPPTGSSNRDTNVNINITRDGKLIQTETIPQGNSSHMGVAVP